MKRIRMVSFWVLLATLTLVSEGVIHESHAHADGTINPTCVCHGLTLDADFSVVLSRHTPVPPTSADLAPISEFIITSLRASDDDSRAPPACK